MTVGTLQPGRVLRQALLLWAVAFAAIVAVSLLAPPPWAKVTAVVAFLYLPLAAMRRTGEDARDYGVTLAQWPLDVLLAIGMLAVIAPLFVVGYETWLGHLLARSAGGRRRGSPSTPGSPPATGGATSWTSSSSPRSPRSSSTGAGSRPV